MNVQDFRRGIIDIGALDPEGVHHELKSGLHGRKLDFDIVLNNPDLYKIWVGLTTIDISDRSVFLPDILVPVPNGTSKLSKDVSIELGGEVTSLDLRKDEDKNLYLPLEAKENLLDMASESKIHAKILEDVSTTESSIIKVIDFLEDLGVEYFSALSAWKRIPEIGRLASRGIVHDGLIVEHIPVFPPEACEYCDQDWELINYK